MGRFFGFKLRLAVNVRGEWKALDATGICSGSTAHIRSRGEEAKAIKREAGFKARRWVVERTHGWLNRFRRILARWDKYPENCIAMLHFACALIALRAAELLG